MIIRSWRGRAAKSRASVYVEHFRRNVLPELQQVRGFLGASLLRENRQDDVEFLVLTRWASLDAIRAFAGDDIRKAMVEPQAVAALIDFDATVQHYDIVEEIVSPG
jgi:heme-degrading monooxygenase HmoA